MGFFRNLSEHWLRNRCERLLTNVFTAEAMDKGSQVQIPGDDGHLIRRLIGKIKCLLIRATEEQEPSASVGVVNSANM